MGVVERPPPLPETEPEPVPRARFNYRLLRCKRHWLVLNLKRTAMRKLPPVSYQREKILLPNFSPRSIYDSSSTNATRNPNPTKLKRTFANCEALWDDGASVYGSNGYH